MGVGRTRAHLRGDPDGFHDLLGRRTVLESGFRVATDAVRALRDVRHGHGDQLLRAHGQSALGEDALAECAEGLRGTRGQALAFLGQLSRGRRVELVL